MAVADVLKMIKDNGVKFVDLRFTDTRGNLAAGGRGVARPLSDSDRRIAEAVGPELRKRGLLFVGLDVIGDKLTEINVTSPTCIREIDAAYDTNIAGQLMQAILHKLDKKATH